MYHIALDISRLASLGNSIRDQFAIIPAKDTTYRETAQTSTVGLGCHPPTSHLCRIHYQPDVQFLCLLALATVTLCPYARAPADSNGSRKGPTMDPPCPCIATPTVETRSANTLCICSYYEAFKASNRNSQNTDLSRPTR